MPSSPKTKTRWHLVLSGQVQHVGLRYSALYLSRGYGLTGWVKNLPDGRVEMEVQGDTANVRRFYLRLKDRPPIRMDHADITVVPLVSGERTFSVSCWESI